MVLLQLLKPHKPEVISEHSGLQSLQKSPAESLKKEAKDFKRDLFIILVMGGRSHDFTIAVIGWHHKQPLKRSLWKAKYQLLHEMNTMAQMFTYKKNEQSNCFNVMWMGNYGLG